MVLHSFLLLLVADHGVESREVTMEHWVLLGWLSALPRHPEQNVSILAGTDEARWFFVTHIFSVGLLTAYSFSLMFH